MDSFQTYALAYLVGVVSSLTAAALIKWRFRLRLGVTRLYMSRLEESLRRMPFIYQNLEIDLLDNFVQIQFSSVDCERQGVSKARSVLDLHGDRMLTDSKKVLFLGNAGVGKTTFKRHMAMQLIRRRHGIRYLYSKERPVPIYVPLKVLDNSSTFPILRYILEATAFKFKKLLHLASRGNIFLFLDGYDEIAYSSLGDERNFIREELEKIVLAIQPGSSSYSRWNSDRKDAREEFYEKLDLCRVWISSRREFFDKFPFRLEDEKSSSRLSRARVVQIHGIGTNERLLLAKNIFKKYQDRDPRCRELLDAEEFVSILDDTEDHEARALSHNPLFLTIMCFIYARRAIDTGLEEDSVLQQTVYELVLECVSLLLQDLDKEKARDLPAAQRRALLRRRNMYLEEKQAFLRYFAFELFISNTALFSEKYLAKAIRTFLLEQSDFPTAPKIVRELDGNSSRHPNMAIQLVLCGVFVAVDSTRGDVQLDFPHQRFREVLACEFAIDPVNYRRLLPRMHQSQLAEFVELFTQSPKFASSALHREALRLFLRDSKEKENYGMSVDAGRNFSRALPEGVGIGDIVSDFVWSSFELSKPRFETSERILEFWDVEPEMVGEILVLTESAIDSGHTYRLSLGLCLLGYLSPKLFERALRHALERAETGLGQDPAFGAVLAQHAGENEKVLADLISLSADDGNCFQMLIYSASTFASTALPEALGRMDLSRKQQLEILYIYWLQASHTFPRIRSACPELDITVEKLSVIEKRLEVDSHSTSGFCFLDQRKALQSFSAPSLLKTYARRAGAAADDSSKESRLRFAEVELKQVIDDLRKQVDAIQFSPFATVELLRERALEIVVGSLDRYASPLVFRERAEISKSRLKGKMKAAVSDSEVESSLTEEQLRQKLVQAITAEAIEVSGDVVAEVARSRRTLHALLEDHYLPRYFC